MKENKKLYNAMYAVVMVFIYPVFYGWIFAFGEHSLYGWGMYVLSISLIATLFGVYVKPLFHGKQ